MIASGFMSLSPIFSADETWSLGMFIGPRERYLDGLGSTL